MPSFSGHAVRRDRRSGTRTCAKPDGEHAVDTHHGRVPVVGGQRGADLVVGHDRQVDQEAEDACSDEVPESDGDQEHHRPSVRERCCVSPDCLSGAELQERPRLDRQERQRDHLGGREERAQSHVLHRRSGEVQVVHGADDAAGRVQDDVEEDDTQRDCAD